MAVCSKLNRMVRVSSHLEVELMCEDGSRAVIRGLYLGKYHVVFKCWPADRTEEELSQVNCKCQPHSSTFFSAQLNAILQCTST